MLRPPERILTPKASLQPRSASAFPSSGQLKPRSVPAFMSYPSGSMSGEA
jgi:hypothetical protein